jgi:hypothetical protein
VHPFGGALVCLRKFWVVEENQGKIPFILEINGFESEVKDGS